MLYCAEPQFGNLIRAALKTGYNLVPYESEKPAPGGDFTASINFRESEQADNLVRRIFQRDQAAKVLIYVGYSHASETPQGSGNSEERWMAARLKALTGLDPLTIDQTVGYAHSAARYDDPAYALLSGRGVLDTPKVLKQPDGTFFVGGQYAGQVDMQVFHPRPKLVEGRPDWLSQGGKLRPTNIHLKPFRGRHLLQAFPMNEPDDAVPVDQLVIPGGAAQAVLLLPPGTYRLTLQDENGGHTELGRLTAERRLK